MKEGEEVGDGRAEGSLMVGRQAVISDIRADGTGSGSLLDSILCTLLKNSPVISGLLLTGCSVVFDCL